MCRSTGHVQVHWACAGPLGMCRSLIIAFGLFLVFYFVNDVEFVPEGICRSKPLKVITFYHHNIFPSHSVPVIFVRSIAYPVCFQVIY